MPEPQFFPQGVQPSTAQKKAAKVAAIKQSMAGITAAKQAEAEAAAEIPGQLKAAYEASKGAVKLGAQAGVANQLSQQEVGAGYNKAAARQAALTAGIQGGLNVGALGTAEAEKVGAAELAAKAAKGEAAGQLYEQLTGEQKLEKEVEQQPKTEALNIKTEINDVVAGAKDTWGDDEDKALRSLADIYERNKDLLANNPAAAKNLAESIAGIYRDVKDEDWEDVDANTKALLEALGMDKDKFEAVEPWDI